MTATVTSLKQPPQARAYSAPSPTQWRRASIVGATPQTVAAILSKAERGDLEGWADLAEYMLRTDPHVRSVYETLIRSVVAAELVWDPADDSEDAALGAAFVHDALSQLEQRERVFEHLLHGEGVFAGVVEQTWGPYRSEHGIAWIPTSTGLVPQRDVKFDADWVPLIRTWDNGRGTWFRADDSPASWIAHIPGGIGLPPHLAGLLMSCVWSWLFKLWAGNYRQIALERFAAPTALGTRPKNAGGQTPEQLLFELENLSGSGALVVEEGVSVELMSAAKSGSAEWGAAINQFENEVTKAILGSTLNVDVGGMGSRALGESQATTTILPRLQAIAAKLGSTLRRDYAAPILKFNARLFGGRVLPTPIPRFVLEAEEKPLITADLISSGLKVTNNELRGAAVLPEIPADEGGDEYAVPVAKTAPSFERRTQEVGTPDVPLHRAPRGFQMSLPMTSRTTPTRSDSLKRIKGVPWPSDGPVKRS